MQMGLREANQQFSRLMKAVKQGKEVLLTERGKPLAVVKLIEEHGDAHAVVRRLEIAGLLRAAPKRRALPAWTARSIRGVPVSRTVMKDREER
jgi:prevent-host-death family protein